jgi:hypothetical protein
MKTVISTLALAITLYGATLFAAPKKSCCPQGTCCHSGQCCKK